jgi:hypothetical protein
VADPPVRDPDHLAVLSPAERRQRLVLDLLLDEHPAQLTTGEITSAVADDPTDPVQADDVRNAIDLLVADGLVHRHGDFHFATRPAMRMRWLDP